MRPIFFSPQMLSVIPFQERPSVSITAGFLAHALGNQEVPAFVFRLPRFPPVTGSLHEYKLLHIQQRVKLRTLTGFPNLPHLSFPTVIVGDAMQLIKL